MHFHDRFSTNQAIIKIYVRLISLTPVTTLRKKPFENIVEKGENAGNQHFLLFPQCFLPYQRQKPSFQ